MSACRTWLKAVRATATANTRAAMAGSAVLGAPHYTVELKDGSQIYVGRQHCAYCARAEAFATVARRLEEGRALCDFEARP